MNEPIKNYTLVFPLPNTDSKRIENLRLAEIGTVLVDNLPPHSTFKRRFTLKDGFTENNLREIIDSLKISKIKVNFNKIETLGNALVIVAENKYISDTHKSLLKVMRDKVETRDYQYEGDNLKIHLTLFRNKSNENRFKEYLRKITFDKLCLYELDPTPDRAWAKMIHCKDLV